MGPLSQSLPFPHEQCSQNSSKCQSLPNHSEALLERSRPKSGREAIGVILSRGVGSSSPEDSSPNFRVRLERSELRSSSSSPTLDARSSRVSWETQLMRVSPLVPCLGDLFYRIYLILWDLFLYCKVQYFLSSCTTSFDLYIYIYYYIYIIIYNNTVGKQNIIQTNCFKQLL